MRDRLLAGSGQLFVLLLCEMCIGKGLPIDHLTMKMIRNIVSALALTLLLPLGLTAGVGITTIEASKYGVLPGRTHDSGPGLTALLREARALSEQSDSLVIRFAPGSMRSMSGRCPGRRSLSPITTTTRRERSRSSSDSFAIPA